MKRAVRVFLIFCVCLGPYSALCQTSSPDLAGSLGGILPPVPRARRPRACRPDGGVTPGKLTH